MRSIYLILCLIFCLKSLLSKQRNYSQNADFFFFLFGLCYCYKVINSSMARRFEQSIYSLETIYHKISFWQIEKIKKIKLQATGKIAGEFYESKEIIPEQKITFTGNFIGFFEEVVCDRGTMCYFQGKIEQFLIIDIEDYQQKSETIDQIGQNTFIGYFCGFIEEVQNRGKYGIRQCFLKELIERKQLSVQSTLRLILPTFSRLQLKSITAINLQKSTATFSGTFVVSIQFSYELLEVLYHPSNKNKRIAIQLNKDLSIELPLTPGNYADENNDINCSINKNYVMEYKIRRTFNASIDDHYGRFFTPFSLSYSNFVLTFQSLKIYNPYYVSKGFFDKLRIARPAEIDSLTLDFMNLELNDNIDGNLYTSYNELLDIDDKRQRNDLLLKRTTKISFSPRLQSGEYYIATNYLSLFTYHSLTFNNSNAMNENDCWFLGITDKSQNIKEPQVLAISQLFQRQRDFVLNRKRHISKLFHLSQWNHVHVSIPIYKYWVLNIIQIFIPIIILDALSLFIFHQQNGKKEDKTSTLNARIINVASILLAFTALIPLIKARAPRATKVSFIYLIIYFSVLPHALALISSIQFYNAINSQWQKNYRPFKDIFFFISFILLAVNIFSVIIVVARFIFASSVHYQIKKAFNSHKFIPFKNSTLPFGVFNYVRNLYLKRSNQFILHQVYDIETRQRRRSCFN